MFSCYLHSFEIYFLCADERGIRLFAFHGALNRELSGDESGDFNYETRERSNGEWVYENHRAHLRHGDVLYFWIYVQHDHFGYRLDSQRYVYPGIILFD